MQNNYVYINTYLHSRENEIIGKRDFVSILEANDRENAVKILKNRGFDMDYGEDISEFIGKMNRELFGLISKLTDNDKSLDILFYDTDFLNLKIALKSKGRVSFFKGGTVDLSVFEEFCRTQKTDVLPSFVRQAAEDAESLVGSLKDAVIDRLYMETFLEGAKKTKDDFLGDYAESYIAVLNIRTSLRAAELAKSKEFLEKALCPCDRISVDELQKYAVKGKDELRAYLRTIGYNADNFDKWSSNYLMEKIKSKRNDNFTLGGIAAYILGFREGLKALNMAFVAVESGLDRENIQERQSKLYA